MLNVSPKDVLRFASDPVLAARIILGVKLDTFQSTLLKYMWFCPNYLDDSGVSTGKSERLFVCAVLRAILLEHPRPMKKRVVAIYYWSLSTTEEVILPRFDHYFETSDLFRDQFLTGQGGAFRKKLEGAYQYRLRNGNRIELPAGNFINDSKSQASKRFNDLYIDESKEIDKQSEGINKMLLDRATAATFNKDHPVWANHVCLMGHAEDRYTHPAWRRNVAGRAKIHDGSQKDVIMTSNYRDFTKGSFFEKEYRPDDRIRSAKLEMSDEQFRQQWLGLWSSGTAGWYSASARQACRVPGMFPELGRKDPDEMLVFGWDTSAGMTSKADFCYGTVLGVKQIDPATAESAKGRRGCLRMESGEGFVTYWRIRGIYSTPAFNLSADQLSGLIHALHEVFGFQLIVMDPGGGGDWVYKKMRDARQLVRGAWKETTGLVTIEDSAMWPMAHPVVARFTRSSYSLEHIWSERERTGDDGPIDRAHREFRKGWDAGAMQWPPSLEEQRVAEMTPEQLKVNAAMDVVFAQLGEIKVEVDMKNKLPRTTARGFFRFVAEQGKKDGAYSAMYAYMGAFALMSGETAMAGEGEETCVVV